MACKGTICYTDLCAENSLEELEVELEKQHSGGALIALVENLGNCSSRDPTTFPRLLRHHTHNTYINLIFLFVCFL